MRKTREQLIQDCFTDLAIIKRLSSLNYLRFAGNAKLSSSQGELLLLIKKNQPLSLKELADLMQLTPGAITQLTDPLVRAGFLRRDHDPKDRRVLQLTITKAGIIKMVQLKTYHDHRALELAQILTDDELIVMQSIHKKIISYFIAHTPAGHVEQAHPIKPRSKPTRDHVHV